jgi:hypothetical protein
MIRLGITDFDTSHVVEFPRRLDHGDSIDPRETPEIVAFIEAAKKSADTGGAPVEVKV